MVTHEIFPDEGYLVVSASAQTSADEILGYEETLTADPDYQPRMVRLYDFTNIEKFDLNTSEILGAVSKVRAWGLDKDIRVALVTSSFIARGTLSLVVSHFRQQPVKVFNRFVPALDWILDRQADSSSESDEFVTVRLSGNITMEDVFTALMDWLQSPGYEPARAMFWDMRGARPKTSLDEIEQRAPFIVSAVSASNRTGRTAILVDNHLMELMVKKLAATAGWREEENRVFRDYNAALAWARHEDVTA